MKKIKIKDFNDYPDAKVFVGDNQFEKPLDYLVQSYAGPVFEIATKSSKTTVVPEHLCLIKNEDGKMVEKSAKEVTVGDIFLVRGIPEKIETITKKDYEGKIYSFAMPSRKYVADDILTKNCCRLRLDLRELTKKNGSLFGAGENTGSVGVVTLNLPRVGYLSNSEEEFFQRLDAVAELAKESLERKRVFLTEMFMHNMYPYTKRWLPVGYQNHFSTIGILGMHECCLNFLGKDKGIATKEGLAFSIKVLNYLRTKCSDFQEETGHLYNLESSPAESTSYRLAMHDKKLYPDIVTAGTHQKPFYTNSSNLPVDYTEDLFEALEVQEQLQTLYTGGCVTLDTIVDLQD